MMGILGLFLDLYAEPHFFFERNQLRYFKIFLNNKGASQKQKIDSGSLFVGAPLGFSVYIALIYYDFIDSPTGNSITNIIAPGLIVVLSGELDKRLFYDTGMSNFALKRSALRTKGHKLILACAGYSIVCIPMILSILLLKLR